MLDDGRGGRVLGLAEVAQRAVELVRPGELDAILVAPQKPLNLGDQVEGER